MAKRDNIYGQLLQLLLAANIVYFICMTAAHFFSIKVPILFIYWDTPFYAYQDKIIAFCAANYVWIFVCAHKQRIMVPCCIGMLIITTIGLSLVNLSSDLQKVLTKDQTTMSYWVETAMIGVMTCVMAVLYVNAKPLPKEKQ